MKEKKYDKNNFLDALLKEWDKTRKQISESMNLDEEGEKKSK